MGIEISMYGGVKKLNFGHFLAPGAQLPVLGFAFDRFLPLTLDEYLRIPTHSPPTLDEYLRIPTHFPLAYHSHTTHT